MADSGGPKSTRSAYMRQNTPNPDLLQIAGPTANAKKRFCTPYQAKSIHFVCNDLATLESIELLARPSTNREPYENVTRLRTAQIVNTSLQLHFGPVRLGLINNPTEREGTWSGT